MLVSNALDSCKLVITFSTLYSWASGSCKDVMQTQWLVRCLLALVVSVWFLGLRQSTREAWSRCCCFVGSPWCFLC